MRYPNGALPAVFIAASVMICSLAGFSQDEAVKQTTAALSRPSTSSAARIQARLLHDTLHQMLHAVHESYYREDEGLPIPATVLAGTFPALSAEHSVKLRWLAVDGIAMNTDHRPQDAFERAAVAALKGGQGSFEQLEGQRYRHAGAIRLAAHCLKCHVPGRRSTADHTAGLIIEMQLADPSSLPTP
jgi:hypothetical protein